MTTKTHVDNTKLMAFANCETQGAMAHVFHLHKPESVADLECGGAGHACLEGWAKEHPTPLEIFTDLYKEWAADNVAIVPQRLSYENVYLILKQWLETYNNNPDLWFQPIVADTETIMTVDLTREIQLHGLFDLPIIEKATGDTSLIDHKFRNNISDWWRNSFKLNSQFSGYLYMASEIYGKPVDHMWVNALETSNLVTTNAKCRTHKVPRHECAQYHANLEMFRVYRTPDMIAAWKQYAIDLADHIRSIESLLRRLSNESYDDGNRQPDPIILKLI